MRKSPTKYIGLAVALALVIGISTSAFSQSVNRTVVITRAAKLGGQTINPGKYTVVFDEKKDGEVAVSKDGKEIVKASYKLLELAKAPADSAVVFAAATDGSLSVRRIEIKGLKAALQFE
jgi:hypothetical protein